MLLVGMLTAERKRKSLVFLILMRVFTPIAMEGTTREGFHMRE